MDYQFDEGKKGEDYTKFACGVYLKPPRYRCYHDILAPHSAKAAQIDHIIVSEYGIFVLETKNISGHIYGSILDPRWTQILGSKSYKFLNPIKQNDSHIQVLANYLNFDVKAFCSVIVFWGECTFKTAMPENVLWERGFINYIRGKQNSVISHDQMIKTISALNNLTVNTTEKQRQSHVELMGNAKICPFCGGRLIKHTVVKPYRPVNNFLGCSNFPRCRFSRNID